MTRDFTQQTYERLISQLETINGPAEWLEDKAGDALLWMGTVIKWIDIEEYQDRIPEYHAIILDRNNTTKAELDAIFENVADVDTAYGNTFSAIAQSIKDFTVYARGLSETMEPSLSAFTSERVESLSEIYAEALQQAKAQSKTIFKEQVVTDALALQKDSLKQFGEAGLSMIGDTVGMFTKDPVGKFRSGWSFCNNACKFLHQGGALIGTGLVVGLMYLGASPAGVHESMKEMKKYSKVGSVADAFEKRGDDGRLDKSMETAAGIYDTAGTVYDTVDFFKTVQGKQKKPVVAEKLKKGYDRLKKAEKYTKAGKYAWKIAGSGWGDIKESYHEGIKQVIGSNPLLKTGKQWIEEIPEIVKPYEQYLPDLSQAGRGLTGAKAASSGLFLQILP